MSVCYFINNITYILEVINSTIKYIKLPYDGTINIKQDPFL